MAAICSADGLRSRENGQDKDGVRSRQSVRNTLMREKGGP